VSRRDKHFNIPRVVIHRIFVEMRRKTFELEVF
jgi:hypothetical protein